MKTWIAHEISKKKNSHQQVLKWWNLKWAKNNTLIWALFESEKCQQVPHFICTKQSASGARFLFVTPDPIRETRSQKHCTLAVEAAAPALYHTNRDNDFSVHNYIDRACVGRVLAAYVWHNVLEHNEYGRVELRGKKTVNCSEKCSWNVINSWKRAANERWVHGIWFRFKLERWNGKIQ